MVSFEISLNLVFLINLFGDTNVACIFYKSSQTYGTHTNGDSYLGIEGVYIKVTLKAIKSREEEV